MAESHEQAAVIADFRWRYKESQALIFAIPNGTHIKSYAGRTKAKKEGLTKGIPDLMIACARGGFHGLFIEMKDRGKTKSSVSKEQKEKIEQLKKLKYQAKWCPGFKAAKYEIDKYMGLK